MDDHATIEYDDFGIGNPTRYYNYATFTWSGRRLTGVTKRWETTPITYTYNDDGLRTSKTVNGETRYFLWENGRLVAEVIDGPSASEYKAIYYTYDAAGHPESMVYVDMTYDNYNEAPVTLYYFTDVFGNVKALFDGSGNVVATYEYDAWGCLITGTSLPTGTDTVSTLARHNPLLYRGYYYDEETGFYYVKSRYYDPVICRWISPDSYVSTGQDMNSFNMFAYCGNNPVNRIDSNGQFWKKICNWFQSIWNEVKIWAGNTFGAEYTVSTTTLEREEEIIPEPSPVTVKSGVRVRKTSFRRGDSSKPISVYADKDSQNPIIASSAGIKVNISDFTLDISVGLNNTGISGSFFNGTDTKSFGEIANLSELKIGFEGATSIAWDNDKTETAYTNCSANGAIIAAIYALVTTGQCSFRPLTDIEI